MNEARPLALGVQSKLVIVIAVLLIFADVLWYGVKPEVFERLWRQLVDRPSGPLSFRFILQPSIAAIAAIYDGIKDARAGRSPFLWTIATNPGERVGRLSEGLAATARIILIGLVMDVVYQLLVFNTFYPNEALIIALLLTFVPYVIIRGPAARIARRWFGGASNGN
jgi:hypothetical protein